MNSNQYTPGPWTFDGSAVFPDDGNEDSTFTIAEVCKHGKEVQADKRRVEHKLMDERDTANARLIAAAPDLLAACEELLEDQCHAIKQCGYDPKDSDTINRARAAIAKAKNITL